MIAAVWKIVSMPSTAAATVSVSQMSPSTTCSRGCAGSGDGARSNERTSMAAVEQLRHQVGADEAGAPGDQDTWPSSVVSVASPMPTKHK